MNAKLKKHRSGVAMILVVVVMAAAAIMGFALLSSASMQAQASRNSNYASVAEDLCNSGTNVAVHYLMNPDKAPTAQMTTTNNTTFYNPGTTVGSLSLSNGAAVTNLAVTLASRSGQTAMYNVAATANSGTTSGAITRTQRSSVQVSQYYVPKYAFACNDSFTIPLTFLTSSINGPTRVDGGMGGLLSAITGILFGTPSNPTPTFPVVACPAYDNINLARTCSTSQTYTLNNGPVRNCNTFAGGTVTNASFVPGANNPSKIYYSSGTLTLSGNITLNGTLVLHKNAALIVAGNTTITPTSGYPALIVGKDVIFSGAGRALNVNGLAWVGGNITGTGLLPAGAFVVDGSLMMAGTNPKLDTLKLLGLTSRLTVTWPSSASPTSPGGVLYVPEFSDADQTPQSVKVLSTTVQ